MMREPTYGDIAKAASRIAALYGKDDGHVNYPESLDILCDLHQVTPAQRRVLEAARAWLRDDKSLIHDADKGGELARAVEAMEREEAK